ncbi:amino acid permease-domain-containing protein [Bisporella sp. PMI_857]|nr:amino acid permease-domain-containing protein [Bisporella sp. PMI_857]
MEMNNLRLGGRQQSHGLLTVGAAGGIPSSTTHPRSDTGSDGRSEEDLEMLRVGELTRSNSSAGISKLPKEEDLLKPYQVFAVIANRMIGTGIFNAPTAIILQTENVGWSMILWVVGFIATMAGTLMYIEYGLTIPRRNDKPAPRSGGELNYLDHLLPRPKYFASCIFGILFILVGNSAANAISCGINFLAAAGIAAPHVGHVQAIAIAVAWLVCVFHASGRMFGIHLNSLFATLKIAILCMMIILGFMILSNRTEHMHRDPASYANLEAENSFHTFGSGKMNHARGYSLSYLYIIFTYGGFNQANYWIVVPLPRDGKFATDFSVVGEFFKLTLGKHWGDEKALRLMHVFLGISSLGNAIVTTFTAARVKQEIAKRGILPYSMNMAHDVNVLEKISEKLTRNGTETITEANAHTAVSRFQPIPLPALILHGMFTTILILATLGISSPRDSYGLIVGIYSYTIDAIIGASLAFGMICMRVQGSSGWNSMAHSNRWVSLATAIIYFAVNAIPVIMLWIPASKAQLRTNISWEAVPVAGWSLIVAGLVYWLIFYYVVPVFKSGRVLYVEVTPTFRVDSQGNQVQVGERFERRWLVPAREHLAQS